MMSVITKNERIYGDYFKILQRAIERMARNSFLIKAWTVTLVSAILVLTVSVTNIFVLSILIGTTIIFWGLDSYYLRFERLYRKLYKEKVKEYNDDKKIANMKLFIMDIVPYKENEDTTIKIMQSGSVVYFYSTITAALSLLLIISSILFIIQ